MKILSTKLKDAFFVELEKIGDERGFFARTFCTDEFKQAGIEVNFVQQNLSKSADLYTLRGMHYQVGEYSEAKYIRCHKGAIRDVIIDIRKESSTFLQHEVFELTENNFRALYVPKGFAHGFITLSEDVVVSYLVSSVYNKDHERGIRWNDPLFNIDWPTNEPILSDKDRDAGNFDPANMGLNSQYYEM